MELNMKPIDRFLAKVSIPQASATQCWVWKASRTQQGYGMFSYQGKSIPAHRFAFKHYVSEIPDSNIVHQVCQNNCCVNPDHLIICTKSESRLKYNSTRIHPDAKKLIQNIKEHRILGEDFEDFGFSKEV